MQQFTIVLTVLKMFVKSTLMWLVIVVGIVDDTHWSHYSFPSFFPARPNAIKSLQMWSWVDNKTSFFEWPKIISVSCLRPKVCDSDWQLLSSKRKRVTGEMKIARFHCSLHFHYLSSWCVVWFGFDLVFIWLCDGLFDPFLVLFFERILLLCFSYFWPF